MDRCSKSAVTIARQHGDELTTEDSDRQVRMAVAVEVPRAYVA